MDFVHGDLRFALRSLRHRPGFTLTVVATVAIAIAATTTMMGVVNAAIMRPLPFRDAGQLVYGQGFVVREQDGRGLSYLESVDWREQSRAFDGLAAYANMSFNVADGAGEPMRVPGELVSSDFFRVLGAGARQGRTFDAADDRAPDASPVAVIGHGLWQSRFGGIASVVGRSIAVNGRPFTIVGVMPPGFRGLSFDSEIWIPTMMVSIVRPVSTLENRSSRWLGVVGRIKPGLTRADAQRDLDRVAADLARAYPETNADRGARLISLRDYYLGTTDTLLLALFGAVVFLLLIACANVMSLQLVRASSRRREMALRVALGAGRRRLVRQLLAEGVVLAAAGTALGVLLASWGMAALVPLAPAGLLPAYADVSVDANVLAGTALIAAVAGIAFGLVPALARSRGGLVTDLKEGAPSAASGLGSFRRARAQQVFVVGEVALALVLLTGAALMARSLRRQLGVDPGFRPDGVVAGRVVLPLDRYSDSARVRFASQLAERLGAIPGVNAAAVGADLPLRGLQSGGYLSWEGAPPEGTHYARHRVTPEYFAALDIPLERGRLFTAADGPDAPRVAVVSASMARRLWPHRDAVGERITLAGTDRPIEIQVVGVVGDVRFRDLTASLEAPLSQVDVYFPFAQESDETLEIAARGDGSASLPAGAIRRVVQELDPALPVFDVAPLADALAQQTSAPRFGSLMLTVFSAIAIVLAAVGIYGLLAFVVGSSSRDIAIRMALGAASARVVGLVVRKGMALAATGALIGVALAVPSTRALSAFLYGVRPSDPLTLAGVTALLLAVAFVACWFPARRASRVAPQVVLKAE